MSTIKLMPQFAPKYKAKPQGMQQEIEQKAQDEEIGQMHQIKQDSKNAFLEIENNQKKNALPQPNAPEPAFKEKKVVLEQALPKQESVQEESKQKQPAFQPQQLDIKRTIKEEQIDLSHYGASGKLEDIKGWHKFSYDELEKISRQDGQQKQKLVPIESGEELERKSSENAQARILKEESAKLAILKKAEQEFLRSQKKAESLEIKKGKGQESIDLQEGKKEEKQDAAKEKKGQAILAGQKKDEESQAYGIKRLLDEAYKQNRPAMLVNSLLEEREGPLDLLSIDEKKAKLLYLELEKRINEHKKQQEIAEKRIMKESDAIKKRALLLRLRRIRAALAFYSKTSGMLGRLLGGFFAKVGLKKLLK